MTHRRQRDTEAPNRRWKYGRVCPTQQNKQRKLHLWPLRADCAARPMTQQLCPTSMGQMHKQQVQEEEELAGLHLTDLLPLRFNTQLNNQWNLPVHKTTTRESTTDVITLVFLRPYYTPTLTTVSPTLDHESVHPGHSLSGFDLLIIRNI